MENNQNIFGFAVSATPNQREQEVVNYLLSGNISVALSKALEISKDGNPIGYYIAGRIYEAGEGGITRDVNKARECYEKAVSEIGSLDTYLALANLHSTRCAHWCDDSVMFDCLQKAINLDSDNMIANFMLGRMYYFGQHVDRDLDKSRDFFEKSSAMGHILSYTFLSRIEKDFGNYLKSLYLKLIALSKFLKLKISAKTNNKKLYGMP